MLLARPQSNEVTVNNAMPIAKMRFRPYWLLNFPKIGNATTVLSP